MTGEFRSFDHYVDSVIGETKMANTTEGAGAVTGKRTREARSDRGFVDATGAVQDDLDITNSSGASYKLLGTGGRDFTYIPGTNANMDRMFAMFGFVTKVGNVANTVFSDKNEPGGPTEAADAIDEFLAGLQADPPVWADRTGGVGARVDRDVLSQAILNVVHAAGKTEFKDGSPLDIAVIRKRLDDEQDFFKSWKQVAANEYATLMGRKVVSVDEALASI